MIKPNETDFDVVMARSMPVAHRSALRRLADVQVLSLADIRGEDGVQQIWGWTLEALEFYGLAKSTISFDGTRLYRVTEIGVAVAAALAASAALAAA
ncbi:MAG: hypothetical protein AAF416_12020 [Pseudomonadota bacterium]